MGLEREDHGSAYDELIDAWIVWDKHPGDPGAAGRMEAACWVAAKELGLTATELRTRLSEGRRQGYGRTEVANRIWFQVYEERR